MTIKLSTKNKKDTARLQQLTAAYKQILIDKKAMWAVVQAVAGSESPEPKRLSEFKLAENIKAKCKAVATTTAKGWKEKYTLEVSNSAAARETLVSAHQSQIAELQARLDQATSSVGTSQPQEAPSANAQEQVEEAAGSNGGKFKATLLELQAELASMQRLGKELAAGGAALTAEKQRGNELEERVEELTKAQEENESKLKKWQTKCKQIQQSAKEATAKLKDTEANAASESANAAKGGAAQEALQEELAEVRQQEGEKEEKKEAILARMKEEKQVADSKHAAKAAAVNSLQLEVKTLTEAVAEGEGAKEETGKKLAEVQEALEQQQKQVADLEEAAR
jgi:chromosome segregation ATPase